MARAFVPSQEISGTTTVAKNLTNFSMAGWIRRPASATHQAFGFNENANHRTMIIHFTDNVVYFLLANGANALGFITQNVTDWNHLALIFNGAGVGNAARLTAYLNGAALTLSFTGTIPATTSNNVFNETLRIGRAATASPQYSTGDFAELGMWQATLTAEEVASLAKGMTCDKVRPQSLVYYTPLIRDIQDLARGMTLTNTNSTVANHPRVYA
jgi:hypothetical protein